MLKIIAFFFICSNVFAYTGVENLENGKIIRIDDFNDRIYFINSKFQEKGVDVALPLMSGGKILASDVNNLISVLNNLNLAGFGLIDEVEAGDVIDASFLNTLFKKMNYAQQMCTSREECYQLLPKIVSGDFSHILYKKDEEQSVLVKDPQEDLLFDAVNNRFLGVHCDSWYDNSEKSWASIILEENKSNFINVSYTSPADQLNHIVYSSAMPTCGKLAYSGNQYCRTYGYPYLTINGIEIMGSGSGIMGNGGCWSGNGVLSFDKGAVINVGSHWGSYVSAYSGY